MQSTVHQAISSRTNLLGS